jgi:D-glycero-alpha-D-manno-heptose-7-phosphate kinase
LPLGGGSTDIPSYYEKYGGFIFAAAIDMYMDIFIKRPRSDNSIHVHYKNFEAVASVDQIKHEIAREALRLASIGNKVAISFKSDTTAGSGMGSSGACAVGLFRGLSLFQDREISNLKAAELSFDLTRNLGLPDGKQDPYACALGGFVVLEIDTAGAVEVIRPAIACETVNNFFERTLFFYTGVVRDSAPLLAAQSEERAIAVKHRTKEIGREIYRNFLKGDLNAFGDLLDEHWQIKRQMSADITSGTFDEIYAAARMAGALGGKIMGAGGGGYFMFYCPSAADRCRVREALAPFDLFEMHFALDEIGARAKVINI